MANERAISNLTTAVNNLSSIVGRLVPADDPPEQESVIIEMGLLHRVLEKAITVPQLKEEFVYRKLDIKGHSKELKAWFMNKLGVGSLWETLYGDSVLNGLPRVSAHCSIPQLRKELTARQPNIDIVGKDKKWLLKKLVIGTVLMTSKPFEQRMISLGIVAPPTPVANIVPATTNGHQPPTVQQASTNDYTPATPTMAFNPQMWSRSPTAGRDLASEFQHGPLFGSHNPPISHHIHQNWTAANPVNARAQPTVFHQQASAAVNGVYAASAAVAHHPVFPVMQQQHNPYGVTPQYAMAAQQERDGRRRHYRDATMQEMALQCPRTGRVGKHEMDDLANMMDNLHL